MFKKIDFFYLDLIKKRYNQSLNQKYLLPIDYPSLVNNLILVKQDFIIIQEINNNFAYFTLIVLDFDGFSKALRFIDNSLLKIKYPFVIINLSSSFLKDYQRKDDNLLQNFSVLERENNIFLILNKTGQLKYLYKLSFNDSSNYIDYYFEEKIKNLSQKTLEINDCIISALYLKQQTINYHQHQINSKIIVGASTHPLFTKRGLMSSLIADTLNDCYNQNIPLVTLNPFDEKFYQKYNFVAYSFYHTVISKNNSTYTFRKVKFSDIPILLNIYNQFCLKYDIYTIRDYNYFENLYKEIIADNDQIIIIAKNNHDIGYYIKINNVIEEYCHLDNVLATKHKEYIQRPANYQNTTLNMARIINPLFFLKLYPYKRKPFTVQFRIIDNVILKNNIIIKLNIDNNITITPTNEYDFSISIEELSTLLLVGNITNNPHPFYQLFKISHNLTWEKY